MTAKTSNRAMEEERMRLAQQINDWNANRYDLFAITLPNENNEFFGVMRFFFQETGSRVSTKCIRVSNTASTQDVLNTLVEKFRPDMRMLSLPKYALYEVHVNGEERKLREDEYPLVVQLNWGKDDREGRFLLKNMDEKTALPKNDSITNTTENPAPAAVPEGGFKRKLSKREKKEQKKREKEEKLKDKENKSPGQDLYKELPDTSFTRSISNPEAVMRKRRQIKLEKKLQQIRSQDGGPDKGGTLKIYGESIQPDVPYKTLLLSTNDTTSFVVKETLEKYGKEKEDPDNYCLVQVLLPPGGPEYHGPGWGGHKEYILEDDDCPLSILMHTPPSKGTVMFQLKRRPPEMAKKRKKRSSSASRMDSRDRREDAYNRGGPQREEQYRGQQPENMPFLVEINPDGTEPYKARKFPLPPNGCEVGSEQAMSQNGQYMQLHGPDIYPRHCVITCTEGMVVTVTPIVREAETYVNNVRIHQTTVLKPAMVIRFGKMHTYRFCDPFLDMAQSAGPIGQEAAQRRDVPGPTPTPGAGPGGDNFETTFDVDGHIETKAGPPGYQQDSRPPDQSLDLLPCSLEYKEEGEDAFLSSVISEIDGGVTHFKLAPTYTLYMSVRYRVRRLMRMDMSAGERTHWINTFGGKVVSTIQQTIQNNRENAATLSFWMANSSELLHFLKQDREVSGHTKPSQDQLAQAVQMAFHMLVDCMQGDLHHVMPAFLDESMDDLQGEDEMNPNMYSKGKPTTNEVLGVLSSAMSLLRRCRVNAALTIQLFSQLFHFINMWLFNQVVLQPQLCTAAWGHRLKRRLGRVEIWAEKHGLELAADCHLARIIQAAHLLEAPKANPDDIANISSTCFKLNSLQLRALLERYIPSPGEPRIPPELVSRVVAVAQNMSDELLRSEGRQVRLEEDPDLQLPFLLPEDGYSCDIVKGVPNGLTEFLHPVTSTGLCRLNVNHNSSGLWTSYIGQGSQENLQQMGGGGSDPRGPPSKPAQPAPQMDRLPEGFPPEPEVIKVTFNKVKGSIGLSIVAAMGDRQRERGVYIKSVVPGGGAAQDGRLQAGDQLLSVDGHSLIGLTQEKAAEYMMHTGQTVTLEVAKQGAIYHGLTSLLTQPSPVIPRGSPNRSGPAPQNKPRPMSEDASRFMGGAPEGRRDEAMDVQQPRPLHLQHGARSSPNLPNSRMQEPVGPGGDQGPYGGGIYANQPQHPAPQPQKQPPPGPRVPPGAQPQYRPDPREIAMRSRSTTHIDQAGSMEPRAAIDSRHAMSVSTLPRSVSHQQPQPQAQPQQRYPSHPEINRPNEDPRSKTYENFPQGARPAAQSQGPYGDGRRDQEIKTAQSMGNIRTQEPPQQKMDPSSRPRSEEFDRRQMPGWQSQGNEPNNQNRRQGPPGPNQYGGPPNNRGARNQPPSQSFYRGPQEPEPQFEQPQRRGLDDSRSKPEQKPVPASRPSLSSQDDPRKHQQQYDPRQQQQQQQRGANQGQYPYNNQPGQLRPPAQSQYGPPGQGSTPNQRPYERRDNSPDLPPPPPSSSPPSDPHGFGPPDDLPPPPPPSSNDSEHQAKEEQERMMRRYESSGGPSGYRPRPDQPQAAPRSQPQTYQNLPPSARSVNSRPQEPESQPSSLQYHYAPRPAPPQNVDKNISNLAKTIEGDVNARIRQQQAANGQIRPQSDAKPRPVSAEIKKKPPPPIASKPKLSVSGEALGSSPWEREQKERDQKRQEDEVRYSRQQEISLLESRTYLGKDETERLQRLRLDEEFDRRVREAKEKGDEDGDSDTEMTDRAVGRAKVLQLMQRDVERRQQQQQEERRQQQVYDAMGEAERREKQERRLAQFDQEREEHKRNQMMRQEKKAQETEEYLRKQRELRDKQRQEFEEQRRQQKLEDERLVERQREELRRKKQMEQDQLREIQAAREEEERQLREAVRRQEAESSQQRIQEHRQERDAAARKEAERQDKYSHLVYSDPANRGRPSGPNPVSDAMSRARPAPPSSNGNDAASRARPAPSSNDPMSRARPAPPTSATNDPVNRMRPAPPSSNGPPAPPERKSSYDLYGRSGSMSNLGQPEHEIPGGSGPTRSVSTSVLRQQEMSKKTVSFNTKLTEEIHDTRRFESTSSESSYREYQTQVSDPGSVQGQQDNSRLYQGYQGEPSATSNKPTDNYNQSYQRPPTSSAPTDYNQSFQRPPATSAPPSDYNQSFQRPSYGQTTPQSTTTTTSYEVFSESSSKTQQTPQSATNTPGVIGAQEVYRDPRDRIRAAKGLNNNTTPGSEPQRMSFRDKMKMFAKEAGETTPQDRSKISQAQRRLETEYN